MNINEAFPSNYLKAHDLQNGERVMTITSISMESIGDDHKPVVYFKEHERGLVLNKTNATNIAEAYGPDTDQWNGCAVVLFKAWVDFQGKSVEAIRVRPSRGDTQQSQKYDDRNPPPPGENMYSKNMQAG